MSASACADSISWYTAALEALGEEYDAAYNEARESLDKQIGLFEKLHLQLCHDFAKFIFPRLYLSKFRV